MSAITTTVSRKRKEVGNAKKEQKSYTNTGNVCIFNSPNKCTANVVIYTNPLAEKEAFTLKYPQRVNDILKNMQANASWESTYIYYRQKTVSR